MPDSTIKNDVQPESDSGTFNAVDAFHERFGAPKKATPDVKEREEATEENEIENSAESDTAEQDESGDEPDETGEAAGEDETTEPEADADPDEKKVSVKVGDDVHEVTIKDLKRLFGQEASLTKKSQEASAALKRATEEGEKAVAIYSELIRRSEQNWKAKGFDQVDLAQAAVVLQHNPEAYKQLKRDYIEAQQHHAFLVNEANGFVQQVRQNRAAMQAEALKKADEALASDPETKGWGAEMRKEIADYAIKGGVPADVANNLAETWAIKMLIKAMKFDKGVSAATKVKSPAVSPTPKKAPIKPGAMSKSDANPKFTDAMSKLKKTGKMDDAAAAFSARFSTRARGALN